MAVSVGGASKTIQPARRQGLNTTPIYHGPEGATQTFKRGAPLIYSSGYLVIGASAPLDTDDSIVGFATHDGRNGATDGLYTATYVPAGGPHLVFIGLLIDKVAESHTLVATNLGLAYAIDVDSSGYWYLDENNTTKPVARVIELIDPVGTVNGRVAFIYDLAGTVYTA